MKLFPATNQASASRRDDDEQQKPQLNHKNWLNLLAFIINVVFTYGVGNSGWFGNGTNGELSDKYQTLVTPKSTGFIIWAVIFVFQAIFVLVQFLPKFRAAVQQGVSYWYLAVCAFQVAWTFAFAYEIIWLSMLFIFAIWASLCGLLYTQYYYTPSCSSSTAAAMVEFWLLRFPFSIHCGWLTAASVLNVNVLMVYRNASADVQLAVAIVSLAYLHAVSVWVLFGIKRRPDYTIASVLSWAFGWIYAELQNPMTSIVDLFGWTIVSGVSYAAIAVAFIIATQIVVRACYHSYFVIHQKGKTARGDDRAASSSFDAKGEEAALNDDDDKEQDDTGEAIDANV